MDWFAKNSGAIQAIASIASVVITAALVGVTYWYVRVTRTIATSAVDQVNAMKAAAKATRQRNVRALADLAARIRAGLGRLNADVPQENQLRAFSDVNESDIARLELFALQIDNAPILAAEGSAVTAARYVLGMVEEAKRIHPGAGWALPQERIEQWRRAREESDRRLREIEEECATILGQDAASA